MGSFTARTDDARLAPAARRALRAPVVVRALEALADCPDSADECERVLDLLRSLDGDAETLAAAIWFYPAQAGSPVWQRIAPSMPQSLQRLVDGQLAAERVWQLHAAHGDASEGLRR